MATLRIEHAIHDYGIWQQAFDSFAEARAKAGVRSVAIRQPLDDPEYLMLDLEFDTPDRAEAFAAFLHQHVWSSPESSPALAGAPQTRILNLRRDEQIGLPFSVLFQEIKFMNGMERLCMSPGGDTAAGSTRIGLPAREQSRLDRRQDRLS